VEVVGIPFISGGKPAVQLVVRDITERKRTEDALKTSESNYRAIFDNASDAFFVIDMHTKQTLDVNRTTCEMFGYERDRMLDLEIGDFSAGWEPFTQRDGLRWLRKAEEGEAQIFEWLAKDKGGRLFWVEVNIKRAEVGGEKTLLGIVRHITERKKAEQQIIEQRNRAELYLDILSHDITNLNQAVMAYGEMLQIGDHPADKYKRFARNSWQQANAISDLISNVHKLSRLQGGDFSVRTVDAARYLESAVEKLMTANPGRNIKIDQDVSGTPLEVHGNEYLEDVFKNIMSHAVRQDLSNDVELRIKHSPSDEGKFLRLDFEDMGPGLSDEMKENIFRRLEAGDDGIEGTSFGLTFVREALTRCGGLVWVEDREKGRPEAGSRFVVLLPRG